MSMLSAQRDRLRKIADDIVATESERLRLINGMYLPSEIRDAADTIWQLRNDCVELRDENAKLRELVRAAWRCIHTGASCSDCRLIAGGCTLQTAMRELGVEVPDV